MVLLEVRQEDKEQVSLERLTLVAANESSMLGVGREGTGTPVRMADNQPPPWEEASSPRLGPESSPGGFVI